MDWALSRRGRSTSEGWGVYHIQLNKRQGWLLPTAEQGGGVSGTDEEVGAISVEEFRQSTTRRGQAIVDNLS